MIKNYTAKKMAVFFIIYYFAYNCIYSESSTTNTLLVIDKKIYLLDLIGFIM